MTAVLRDLVFDYTLRTVAMGVSLMGFVAGALGAFALLRKESLLGDTISHAALPGVAFAFLFFHSKEPWALLAGAALTGWAGTLLINAIIRHTRVKVDAAMGIILSVFFGFGLVLLTILQKHPTASQAGLSKFLFGNAATLLARDVFTMAVVGGAVLVLLLLFWKEFKISTFDPAFGRSLGLPVRAVEVLLLALIVLSITIGLQTVGVVLMSAMLVAPAAAARQWTDRLGLMVVLAGLFGASASFLGAVASSLTRKLPTGPAIVVCVSVWVMVSLFFAPRRGLCWRWLRAFRHRHEIRMARVMENLFRLAESHGDPFYPHPLGSLKAVEKSDVSCTLAELVKRGWAEARDSERFSLTPAGLREVKALTSEEEAG